MKIDKKMTGLLSLVFGVLILVKPDILALLVAIYLIVFGALELAGK